MLKDYVTVIVSMLLVVSIIGLVEIGDNSITGDVPNLENFPPPLNKDAPIYILGEKASIEDIKGVIETGTPSDLLEIDEPIGTVRESIPEYELLPSDQGNKQLSNEKEEKNKPLPPKEPPEKSWWEKVKDWLFGTKTAVGTGQDIGLNDFPEDVKIMIKEQGGLLSLVEQDVGKIVVVNGNNANEYLLPGNGENIFTIVTDVKKGNYNIELSSKDGKRVVIKAKVEAGEEDKGSYILTKAPTLAQNPLDDYAITTPPDKQGISRLVAAGPINNVETLQPLPRLPVGGIITIGEDGKAQIAAKDPEELPYRSVIKVNNHYGYTGDLDIGGKKTEIKPEIIVCLLEDEKESKPLVLVAPTSNKVTAGVVSASRITGLLIERVDSTPLNPGCPEPEETHNFMLINSISKEFYIPGEYTREGDFGPRFNWCNDKLPETSCNDEDSNALKEYAKEWCSQACSKQECHANFKNINDVSKKSGGSTTTLVSGSYEDIDKAFKCKQNSARTCEQSYKCKCTKPAEGYEVCQAKVTRQELAHGFNINVQPKSKVEICADLKTRIEKLEKEISTIPDFDPVYEMVSSTLKRLKAEYEKDCSEKKTGLVVPGTDKAENTFLLPKNGQEIIIGGEDSKCVALCKERELVAANSDGSVPVGLSRKYSDDVLAQIESSVFECQDLAITYPAPEYVNDCLCFKDQAPRVESAGPTDQKCKTGCGLLSCGQTVTVDGKICSCLHKGWEMDKDGNPVAIIGQ